MNASPKRFGISTWSDVVSLGSLLLVGFGFIQWGLKVESDHSADMQSVEAKIGDLTKEVMELKAQVGNGILPRAEERIRDHDRRITDLEEHEDDHP